MDLMPYVENLRRQLAVAAEAGGPDARALAERLTGALESAARLTLLEALSAAADEITRDLAPGSVDVRLRGGDPAFVVTPPQPAPSSGGTAGEAETAPPAAPEAAPPAGPPFGEEGGTARVTLRLPEPLKVRVEEAAARQGISVNAWLVRAVSAAFEPGAASGPADRPKQPRSGRSYTGWVR
ncbi:toxin-antitoxin system HicB family antitoxin [Microbispora catharanthi]|uniref:Toxin-antitoxin system HicB family antitoxin n=1 Tax=Microbispora catharanthi TaxID=1712871 RepID=A0A5N6BR37_9ACTN|nr:toxin-antitoxin system HicB family antitoxin [Microbispora catharanthi]KAB8182880.1 toxin-antitoxin system HicB family antitoxin [Microbispora catharanthi]